VTKVLVVDDHPLVNAGVKSLLSDKHPDWTITTLSNYEDALNYKKIDKTDIALIDVRLGDKSGLNLAKKYKEKHPDQKIIMFTSFADKKALKTSKEIGAEGFLLKTTQIDELEKAISNVLKGKLYYPETKLNKGQYNLIIANTKIQSLSKKQRMILNLLSDGLNNKEIAEEMYVSEKTVKNYLTIIYKKIECKSRAEAISFIKDFHELEIKLSNKSDW
tara:strand:+ start:1171 stop:1824 length:654 start_codon:yes stop_codon:yes gene_type:complete